jgi:hypothetical protein
MGSKAIVVPAAERVRTGEPGVVAFRVGDAFQEYLVHLFRYQERERRAPSPYYSIKIDTPKRPRTTGDKSQNHHINGHIQEIAMETGQPFEDVKKYAKQFALTMGFPILEDENGDAIHDLWGKPQGISEEDCSTEDAAILIEAIHQLAAELDITLQEE